MNISIPQISAKINKRTLFTGSDLFFQPGEIIALMGKNGSGKSTFLKALAGYDTVVQGTLAINGEARTFGQNHAPSMDIGFIPVKIVPYGEITLLDFVLSGRNDKRSFLDLPTNSEIDEALALIHKFKLTDFKDNSFNQLSDGEQKLGLLCRALFRNATLLLLDEPETFLDLANIKSVFEQLEALAKEGKTIIFSTHQPRIAEQYANKILSLNEELLEVYPISGITELAQKLSL